MHAYMRGWRDTVPLVLYVPPVLAHVLHQLAHRPHVRAVDRRPRRHNRALARVRRCGPSALRPCPPNGGVLTDLVVCEHEPAVPGELKSLSIE